MTLKFCCELRRGRLPRRRRFGRFHTAAPAVGRGRGRKTCLWPMKINPVFRKPLDTTFGVDMIEASACLLGGTVLSIEKCPVLMEGAECGQPVEEETPDAAGLLRVFRCAFGHRSYAPFYPRRAGSRRFADIPVKRIGFDVIEFRKKACEQTWHLTSSCSHWPTRDFISSTSVSGNDSICDECLATSLGPK